MPIEIPEFVNIAEEFVSRPAREHPDRIAILGEPSRFTYGEVAAAVNRGANSLRAWECRPGDRVLIVLPDSIEFIAAFFGAAQIGAIAVPVNSMARAEDYAYYLANSGAKFAVVHHSVVAESVLENFPPSLDVVAITGGEAKEMRGVKVVSWEETCRAASDKCESHPTRPTDSAFFLYTSGSGGTPKAAIHRHEDMLHTSRGFAHEVLGLRSDDITYSVSKLFFAYGLGNGMYFPFSVGASTILDPGKPKPERTAEILATHRPTVLFSVPTFFAALLREAERGLTVDCSSLRVAVSAGETLPAEIFERFKQKFGVEIIDGIGSTEMLHMFLSCRPGKARASSCGTEVPGCEAKIVDDEGREAGENEIGNLWVRGGGAFSGYWNKPELTSCTKRCGWVVTGDKFTRDADGFYHYCGRADDMMKVAGMWVSPGEVENALLAHPLIAEAAVVACENDLGLVRPAAYVVLKNGTEIRGELGKEIRDWLKKKLSNFKCPSEVHFVENLPKTATGKIQRFRLRTAIR
ncbi:MAG TPA: benzoate-CoA ligase family protein [Candidatus Acidoferrales bacterium]|nr:benzoate-CoA ligase family protein [Candidatus Acidoferrales bacterium]HEV2342304.1 benzoate-CoA ligase family protein [Candidatus Acidoferrales bacterium]